MRGKTACFTGHRKIPPESIPELCQRLKNTLLRLIEEGYMYFGAGGAEKAVSAYQADFSPIQEKGGTAYTVNYAKEQGLTVINLASV